jgi:predicted metal-dependent hydrolase
MKRQIKLQNKNVEYLVRKSQRAKRLRLAVYCDGSFVITVPQGLDMPRVEEYILRKAQWVLEKLKIMKTRSRNSVFAKHSKRDYLKLKDGALKIAEQKVEEFNKIYKFSYNKISIRNQKTRWGSCSKKGNLNYNYKIALLPEKHADYIIVHELCHLGEFNHSRKFWNLVEWVIPDYRERIREIKSL